MSQLSDSLDAPRPVARVAWRGRVQLPQGQVLDVKAFELHAAGVDLLSPQPIVAGTVLNVALQMPSLQPGGAADVVTGQAKVGFQVLKHNEFHLHMQWVNLPAETRQRLNARMARGK